jgi:hypothetical protein
MELKITERGRELVQAPEFVQSLVKFMKEWEGPHEEGTEHVCRLICLGMCEVDSENGPTLDSPEFEQFFIQHQTEIEEAARPTVDLLLATRKRFLN